MARFGRATPQPGPTERRAPRLRRGADDYLATLRTSTPERYAHASARAQAGEKRLADGAGQAWETCIGEIAHASPAVGEHSHLANTRCPTRGGVASKDCCKCVLGAVRATA
jgi:hypothetical protein